MNPKYKKYTKTDDVVNEFSYRNSNMMNDIVGEVFGKDKQKLLESATTTSKTDKHRQIIQKKLKLIGWGACPIRGYIICTNVYKVKVDDGSKNGTLITMDKKDGRAMNIYQDRSK